jgi:hypothetical protein
MKRFLSGLSASLSVLGLACAAHAQTKPNDLPPNVANQPAPRTMTGPPATEAQAKELVLRDGYTDVGTLTKGADGMWRGLAKRGEQEMRVTVDTTGKVSP